MRDSEQRTYTIEELIEAIRGNRNISEIQEIIQGVVDVNQADNDGMTALHWAVNRNNLEIVSVLLKNGANINQKNSSGYTALIHASINGQTNLVRHLFQNKAEFDHNCIGIAELLVYTSARNYTEIVRMFLEKGADVNNANQHGAFPLFSAALNGNIDLVALLIAYGADETSLNEEQQTQFAEAIAAGKTILIQRNTKSSACALADTGKELQRVSIMQNHKCRESDVSQAQENKLPEFTEPILALIGAYATDIQRPNSLTQEQITKCAEVGTESLEGTDITQFNETGEKFVARNPGNTVKNILNGNQNPIGGQELGA